MAKAWAEKFYHSKAWKDCRKIVLRRDNYTCVHCFDRGAEVHHLIELTPENINDVTIALNPDNLMSVCYKCHKEITLKQGDIKDGYFFNENGYVVQR